MRSYSIREKTIEGMAFTKEAFCLNNCHEPRPCACSMRDTREQRVERQAQAQEAKRRRTEAMADPVQFLLGL